MKTPKLTTLHSKVDYYGDTWIVNTLSKEDITENEALAEYLPKTITDDDMASIADKLSDGLMYDYWDVLEEVVRYHFEGNR